jgi:hypothetical protein
MALFGAYETSKVLEQIKSHNNCKKPRSNNMLLIYHIIRLIVVMLISIGIVYSLSL